jgi:hypothetical protein
MLIASLLLATTVAATPIPLNRARNAFAEAHLASDEDGGRMWGRPLYGPMIFVDPHSRFAVANQADNGGVLKADGGVFTGTLPKDVIIANTAVNWNGVHWTMVMWGAVGERSVSQRTLLLHEWLSSDPGRRRPSRHARQQRAHRHARRPLLVPARAARARERAEE